MQVLPAPNPRDVCTLPVRSGPARAFVRRADVPGKREAARQSATFEVTYVDNCGGRPWPAEAIRAFEFATEIWAEHIVSDVPIRVVADWVAFPPPPEEEEGGGEVLGAATPVNFIANFLAPPLIQQDTFYPSALADALTGRDLDPPDPDAELNPGGFDIFAQFNCELGGPSAPDWHFGLDTDPSPDELDFVTVVLHELGHGLGFTGSMLGNETNLTAQWGLTSDEGDVLPLIFDRFTEDEASIPVLQTPNAEPFQLYDVLTDSVFFSGLRAEAASDRAPVPLYAPFTWESGSSYSHLDMRTFSGTESALMVHAFAPGEVVRSPGPVTCGILQDIGWELGDACLRIDVPRPGEEALVVEGPAPNPFRGSTELAFVVDEEQRVQVDVYDAGGRRVARLFDDVVLPGSPTVVPFEAAGLPGGVYFYYIRGERFRADRAVVLVR